MPQHRKLAVRRLRRKPALIALALVTPLVTAGIALAAPASHTGSAAQSAPGTQLGRSAATGSLGTVTGLLGAAAPQQQSAPGPAGTPASRSTSVLGGSPEQALAPAAAALPAVGALTGPAAPAPQPATADDGAKVVGVKQINPQMVDLTIDSPALGTTTTARLLLPKDWNARPNATWPTLYLLPGYGDIRDYQAWTYYTNVASFLADKDVLTVLPSDGMAGFFTNWYNGGHYGPPAWETYHTRELPRIIESAWRGGTRRAIAGLSLGGYGAITYAAKNPGMYVAAASYSGLLHTTMPGIDRFCQYMMQQEGVNPDAIWGDPTLQASVWDANDPYNLAQGLKGTALFLSSATGEPGKYDQSLATDVTQVLSGDTSHLQPAVMGPTLEALSNITTHELELRLSQLGIPAVTDHPVAGTHWWAYWQIEFAKSWPTLAKALGAPAS